MIYAIRAVGTEFIKFGKSKNVGRRLINLECTCPLELEIMAIANWPDEAEKTVHKVLEQYWHKGEWFIDSDTTKLVIKCMLKNKLEQLRAMVKNERETSALLASLASAREASARPEYEEAAIAAWYAALVERKNSRAAASK